MGGEGGKEGFVGGVGSVGGWLEKVERFEGWFCEEGVDDGGWVVVKGVNVEIEGYRWCWGGFESSDDREGGEFVKRY